MSKFTTSEKAAKAAKGIIIAVAGATIAFESLDELRYGTKMRVFRQELQIGQAFENYAKS